MEQQEIDKYYMNLAIEQAEIAGGLDEVPVGSVIIDSAGSIIGRGYNQTISKCDPTAHAEIIAIKMAALSIKNYRLCGTTLYSTIEPCVMCMGTIIHARIARLVYGAYDIKWGCAGSLYNFSNDNRFNHNIEVAAGICLKETKEMIQDFFKNKRSNKQCQI